MPLTIQAAGKTDKGLVRSGNQDCYYVDDEQQVYAVCDGMGGHRHGEVASMLATETMEAAFNLFSRDLLADSALSLGRTLPPQAELLVKSIRLANRAIYNEAMSDSQKAGMGTTVVALSFEADVVGIAHVGDSRAYRIGEKALEPLTTDHSWVAEIQASQNLTPEEANNLVGKNIITRALGVKEQVEVDLKLAKVKPGDLFMLCSDGLCGYADDDEIFAVADKYRDDLDELCTQLVQMANDRGGNDNVTIVAVRVEAADTSPIPELDVFTQGEESTDTLNAEDTWLKAFREKKNDLKTSPPPSAKGKKGGGMLVAVIFVAFVAIAAAIIYFSQQP